MAKGSWWGYRPTESVEHGPPSETPATQRPASVRTQITKEGLLHLVVAREGLPMNTLGDQWAVAVSEILLDLLERGVELKTAADPDMPYQQYN